MTTGFSLRTRPDGMVEIVRTMPELVAVFAEQATARKVMAFLIDDAMIADATAFGNKSDMPAGSTAPAIAEVAAPAAADVPDQPVSQPQLPAIVAAPHAPALTPASGRAITPAEELAAFARIECGESCADVSRDMDLPFPVLRGKWAAHVRLRQKTIAAAGQQSCAECQKPFVPGIDGGDKCARCRRV